MLRVQAPLAARGAKKSFSWRQTRGSIRGTRRARKARLGLPIRHRIQRHPYADGRGRSPMNARGVPSVHRGMQQPHTERGCIVVSLPARRPLR
jgi:hypothetical protein